MPRKPTETVWEHSNDLTQLLAELQPLGDYCDKSKLTVVREDDNAVLTLTGEDVAKVLSNALTVDRFKEAIMADSDCTVEITFFDTPVRALDRLQEVFSYVEEIA